MLFYKQDMWDYLEDFARDANQPHQVMNISHAKMLDRLNRKRETEQLKKEITEDVLSRISLNIEERITETLNRVFAEFERK